MLQCNNVAVGYESKYNYIIRRDSIVNCSFNPKKFDLLEMTDKMADDVLKLYPDLKKAVLRDRVAIILLLLGYPIYNVFWNIYCKNK